MIPINHDMFRPVPLSQPSDSKRANSHRDKQPTSSADQSVPSVQDERVIARRAGLLETIAEAQREFLASAQGGSLTIVRAAALIHGAFAGFFSYCMSGAHYVNASDRVRLTFLADWLLAEVGRASNHGLVRIQKQIDEVEERFVSRGLFELWSRVNEVMHREIFRRFTASLGFVSDGDSDAH